MKLTILGCGGSGGVPAMHGLWGACDPHHPQNKRLRTSLLIQYKGQNWLMDAGPDLRYQLLREGIEKIDGVFLTHAHADHLFGLADLRPLALHRGVNIPTYADQQTTEICRKVFGYLIDDGKVPHDMPLFQKPCLEMRHLEESFMWNGLSVKTFLQDHGPMMSRGFRFGSWAYSTDVCGLGQKALDGLKGIDLWFVDCASLDGATKSHANLKMALGWIEEVKPKLAILIHMGISLDYEKLKAQLPKGVIPAYDGMQIDSETLAVL